MLPEAAQSKMPPHVRKSNGPAPTCLLQSPPPRPCNTKTDLNGAKTAEDADTTAPALSRSRKPGLKHAHATVDAESEVVAPSLTPKRLPNAKPDLKHVHTITEDETDAPALSRSRKPDLKHVNQTR